MSVADFKEEMERSNASVGYRIRYFFRHMLYSCYWCGQRTFENGVLVRRQDDGRNVHHKCLMAEVDADIAIEGVL